MTLKRLNEVRSLRIDEGVTLDRPGIYAWTIEGVGCYVGKYTRKSRPLREYDKNVFRLLSGIAYRPQKPNGFRAVHRALAKALTAETNIELRIVCNATDDDLNELERYHIGTLAWGGLNRTS